LADLEVKRRELTNQADKLLQEAENKEKELKET
jgi:hypothetical protein